MERLWKSSPRRNEKDKQCPAPAYLFQARQRKPGPYGTNGIAPGGAEKLTPLAQETDEAFKFQASLKFEGQRCYRFGHALEHKLESYNRLGSMAHASTSRCTPSTG